MKPVRELLEALGGDADAIAACLKQHGLGGARGVGEECPLATWLRINGVREPAVDVFAVSYEHEGRLCVEELPQAAADFVMLFDDGEFPALSLS
jgi:hypothetical protein